MMFMIEATEAERLNNRLRSALLSYDAWHIGTDEPLEIISQNLINAAKACGWDMHTECVDWARERLSTIHGEQQ